VTHVPPHFKLVYVELLLIGRSSSSNFHIHVTWKGGTDVASPPDGKT
jgi:hypothetical protein